MNKLKIKLNVIIIALTVVITGLYVGGYFWIDAYKSVPVNFVHIFGDDLASYKLFDRIFSSVCFGIYLIAVVICLIIINKKKEN